MLTDAIFLIFPDLFKFADVVELRIIQVVLPIRVLEVSIKIWDFADRPAQVIIRLALIDLS